MFDLDENPLAFETKKTDSPMPAASAQPTGKNLVDLDSSKMERHFQWLIGTYGTELERQYENRTQMALDAAYYDNEQWSDEDAEIVRSRGQEPLVYNVISTSVDWILGTERRSRADFKILPRRKEDGQPAERKTQLLKYLSDVNRTPFHRSRSFEDSVKVGVGWLEDGWGADDDDEPIYSRHESWRNCLWDSASTEMDISDGRYFFRGKMTDVDWLAALFPARREMILQASESIDDLLTLDAMSDEHMNSQEISLDWYTSTATTEGLARGFNRRRVRAVEGWYKVPEEAQRIKGGVFHGELFDPYSAGHVGQVEAQNATIAKSVTMRMYVAIFCNRGLLYAGPSPYRHNRFPFTPIWGYRRDRDNQPYGFIRRVRGIQDDINKRASKALFIFSANRIIMDDDALPEDVSVEEFREEAAQPDAVLRKKRGSDMKFDTDRDVGQWNAEWMSRDISMVQQTGGVTDENLGRSSNAKSGIAIQRRQDQGALTTSKFFDNLRLALQIQGEKQLSLMEQFMDEKKQFRITNMRGSPEYVEINNGLPENDIVASKADFVISEADWRATMRQAAVDELMEAMTRWPPEVALVILDLVVENMDLPNRDEIVSRIRSLTGQRDPDAEELTPEEQARAQDEQEAKELQRQTIVANVRKLLSDAEKNEAQAEKTKAEIPKINIETLAAAITAALENLGSPAVGHTADHLLTEAGFEGAQPAQQQLVPTAPASSAPQPQAPQPTDMRYE